MDILAALHEAPKPGVGRCKIGRWLDSFPDDADGKPELVAAFETNSTRGIPADGARTLEELTGITRRLKLHVSTKTIAAHRRQHCECYW